MDKRLSHGWQGSLWYTWSHSIDDVTGTGGGEGNLVGQDWRNLGGNRGNSGFDRRHRLVAHAAVDLPFGAGRRWLQHGILWPPARRLAVVSDSSAQSGAWFDMTILDPTNRLGVTLGSSAWRPDLVGDPTVPHPTADAWLNPTAFAIPQDPDGTYRYGNLGRNTLLGPGLLQSGRRLTKDLRLGGARRLQFRWEVFNLTNHPSFGLPNTELGSADFGTIRSTVSTPRQMQFGVKFLF